MNTQQRDLKLTNRANKVPHHIGILRAASSIACLPFCFTPASADWLMGGADLSNSRSQPATTITKGNAKNLQFNPAGIGDIPETPAVAGGKLYFPDSAGNFSAVDSGTGTLAWAALDPSNGSIQWQIGTPSKCSPVVGPDVNQGCMALGPATVGNGVLFVGSMDKVASNPTMFALDGATGGVLWGFSPGATVNAAPAIDGDSIYWGTGYTRFGIGTKGTGLWAFAIK
jgi:hypothetical protein